MTRIQPHIATPEGFIETRHNARLLILAERERRAWTEYLAATQHLPAGLAYDTTEAAAWHRLLGWRAELASDQRTANFIRDRALADLRSIR